MPFRMLVVFDDLLVGHLGERVSVANPLHVFDGLAGRFVDLAEADRLLGRYSLERLPDQREGGGIGGKLRTLQESESGRVTARPTQGEQKATLDNENTVLQSVAPPECRRYAEVQRPS